MKEPKRIPLNPKTPRAKQVTLIPLKPISGDIMPDNDSVYVKIKPNEINTESDQN